MRPYRRQGRREGSSIAPRKARVLKRKSTTTITRALQKSDKIINLEQFLHIEPKENQVIQTSCTDKDIFYIGYTSGTTGKPKGYMRSHRSWLHSFKGSEQVFNISKSDHILSPGPFVHSHFLYAAIHALHAGSSLYIMSKFDSNELWQLLNNKPINILYVVPTMFSALCNQSTCEPIKGVNTIISAGSKWEVELKEKGRLLFPCTEFFEFYGASELSFVSVLDDNGNKQKPESVGKAFPGVEICIRRQDGTEANENEIGKLFVKSNQVFEGYLNAPEATNEVFEGDWATVGDLAFIDKKGFIHLVGREKNMIISGGLNIYPEEVEQTLKLMAEIDEVICLGIKDAYWGEKLIAVIKWRNSKKVGDLVLKKHCRSYLSSYKCPKQFIDIKEMPHTASGKIARKKVKELITNLQNI